MFLVVWAEISWQTACVRATNNQDYECCKFQRFSSVHKFTINLIKKSKMFAINKSFWKCEVRSKFPLRHHFFACILAHKYPLVRRRAISLERNWNSQNRINKFGFDKSWVTAIFPEGYSDLTLTLSSFNFIFRSNFISSSSFCLKSMRIIHSLTSHELMHA